LFSPPFFLARSLSSTCLPFPLFCITPSKILLQTIFNTERRKWWATTEPVCISNYLSTKTEAILFIPNHKEDDLCWLMHACCIEVYIFFFLTPVKPTCVIVDRLIEACRRFCDQAICHAPKGWW
jgi:hypothetical protein